MIKNTFLFLCLLWVGILAFSAGNALSQNEGFTDIAGEDFMPVSDDLLPLKNRMVSVELRATPLRDTLYSIAETAGLNLIMEQGVNPDLPITLSIKNIHADEAIKIVLNAAGYFSKIRGNILTIKAMETKVFEFGQPAVIQNYSVEVGGDILGTAIESASGFSQGGGGGGSGGSSSGEDIKGKVEQSIASDQTAFGFWDSIENALANILEISSSSQGDVERRGLRPSLSVNRMTGTIVITAPRESHKRAEKYLESLRKVLNRQVIIEARILEVQLSEGLNYGIDWTWLPSDSVTIDGNNFSGIINENSPNIEVHISRGDFTGMIRAIESQGKVKVLSNPRINIMNGQTALLSVGRNQSFLSSVESEVSTGDNPVITYTTDTSSVLSGVMVGIVPYINEQGEVTMNITPIISELIALDEREIGEQGTSISLPTVDLRQLSTTVKVKDGDLVVIGGLVQTKRKTDDHRVPLVGKLPLIGYLFTNYKDIDEKTDIVIILKPMVKT